MSNAQENKPQQFEDLFYILDELRQSEQFNYTDYNNTHILVSQIEAAYVALQAENEKLKQANKKLREGLEQYLNDENWMNGPIRKDGSRLVHNIPTMKRIAEHYIIQADKIEKGTDATL